LKLRISCKRSQKVATTIPPPGAPGAMGKGN
jgi:hypothetical protein